MVRARGLTKLYRVGTEMVHALDHLDLEVPRGEFLAVLGTSGSGKSTLLHMLGALDHPTSGEVWLDSTNLAGLRDRELSRIRRTRIGFIFQTFNLIPTLTSLENVTIPLLPVTRNRAPLRERGRRLLENVGLGDRLHHRPSQLSGGQRQRVAIARALIHQPALVLADEPTGNLDTRTGGEILSLIHRLNREQGTTIIVVSHNPQVAQRADRAIHLRDGQIVRQERP
ncbi:MAG: ABC transporter ATP-binding protein [Euryarchaeota archaeon]|nr:ABC transporter ATP-binding protein [Euryarchaeota archaeon]